MTDFEEAIMAQQTKTSESQDPSPTHAPLAGVKVVELSSVLMGPWACQILGDLGAEVIKVEPPPATARATSGLRVIPA